MERILRKLENFYGVEVHENADGKQLTSFGGGGKIRLLFRPCDVDGLIETLNWIKTAGCDYTLLGNGTNTIIADGGYDGAVITLKRMKSVRVDGDILYASGGLGYPVASAIARDNHLSGLEFAAGIPASVGGAIAMNAGAYNSETADKVLNIDILNGETVETVINENIKFVYRGSAVKDKNQLVLGARFKLNYGDRDLIDNEMKRLNALRQSAQPKEPSAGSVFLRRDGTSPAVYIERLGIKGLRHGGAAISEKHANFIVNVGGATANDYVALRDTAAESVYNNFGIRLIPETRIIGEK